MMPPNTAAITATYFTPINHYSGSFRYIYGSILVPGQFGIHQKNQCWCVRTFFSIGLKATLVQTLQVDEHRWNTCGIWYFQLPTERLRQGADQLTPRCVIAEKFCCRSENKFNNWVRLKSCESQELTAWRQMPSFYKNICMT